MTITGCGFTGATAVKFGTAAATTFTVNSDSQITATSPAHAAGIVDITVTTANGTSATSAADQFNYTTSGACTSAAWTADKPSPQDDGTIITFTGSSGGCDNPQYKWFYQPPGGGWVLAQNYNGATFVWNTAGFAAGTYHVNVWVRQTGHSTDPEQFQNATYVIQVHTPCGGAAITPDKASPQSVGTTVTYTASSTGCSQPMYLWYMQPPGGGWYIAKNRNGPTLTWNTTGAALGTWNIDVWVSQNGASDPHESFKLISYTITGPTPCASASYTADKATPQQSGTIITFTASATGCANPQFKWYVQDTNGVWSLAQNYDGATFVWNTAGLAVGTYRVNVWARQTGNSADPEANFNQTYTLITPVPCAAANVTPDKPSPQPAGTVVTFTATSTGCSQAQYQYFFQLPGSPNWYVAKNWDGATLVWNTTGAAPGTYKINIWARQNGSSTSPESNMIITYTIS